MKDLKDLIDYMKKSSKEQVEAQKENTQKLLNALAVGFSNNNNNENNNNEGPNRPQPSPQINTSVNDKLDTVADSIEENTPNEEEKREDTKLRQKMIESMGNLADGVKSLTDSITGTISKGLKGLGLASLALLFLDPERALNILKKGITVFFDAIDSISELFNGNTEKLEQFIKDNPIDPERALNILKKGITVFFDAIDSISELFNGNTEKLEQFIKDNPIVSAVAATVLVAKSIGAITLAFKALSGAFGGLSGVLGAIKNIITVKFMVVAGAILLAIDSAWKGLKNALNVFEDTGDLSDTFAEFFSTFVSNFVGTILNIPKMALEFILKLMGEDALASKLGEFDFTVELKKLTDRFYYWLFDGFEMIGNVFKDAFSSVGNVVSDGLKIANEWFKDNFSIDLEEPFRRLMNIVNDAINYVKDKILEIASPDTWRKWVGIASPDTWRKWVGIEEDENFFNKNLFGDSEIQRENVGNVSNERLQNILEEESGNLAASDIRFIQDELKRRGETLVLPKPRTKIEQKVPDESLRNRQVENNNLRTADRENERRATVNALNTNNNTASTSNNNITNNYGGGIDEFVRNLSYSPT